MFICKKYTKKLKMLLQLYKKCCIVKIRKRLSNKNLIYRFEQKVYNFNI